MRAHSLEQLNERGRGDQGCDRTHVPQPDRAQLQERITTTGVAEVHAGDGEVERNLLVGFEVQIRQVERLAIDLVSVLLVSRQWLGQDRDALVSQQPLVPLEGLAPSGVLGRIAGNLMRNGVEGERLARVQQHQDQIGDTFEPIELRGGLHRREPTASDGG